MKRLLSGIQTSGRLHLGNYLGAIKNWVKLQNEYETYLFLADMHAITVPQDPVKLKEYTYEVAACYLACGVDPEKSIIFAQSQVYEHAYLGWIFSCIGQIGWLNRMTQFKDKAGKNRESVSVGLYTYPVLQAADILLYKPEIVPVGEDQKQHVELTRDIAGAFNRQFNCDYFNLPEPMIIGEATRVMSLRDGKKKMSKSDESDYSRINLTDDKDTIALKFRKAKSDAIEGISYDPENRPEAANLINIYSALSGVGKDTIVERYSALGFADFKKNLTDLAVEILSPISEKINQYLADKSYIDNVLKSGAEKARVVANKTLNDVKEIIGFIS